MTKPLRHTTHEIENAAKYAAEYNVEVRLEADGTIRFIPTNRNGNSSNNVAPSLSMGQAPKEWN